MSVPTTGPLPRPKLDRDDNVIVLQVMRIPQISIRLDYCQVSRRQRLSAPLLRPSPWRSSQVASSLCDVLEQIYTKLIDYSVSESDATIAMAEKVDRILTVRPPAHHPMRLL